MIDPNTALASLESLSYGGIFLITFFSGYLVPVPEEIVLLSLGYLGSIGVIHFGRAVIVAFLAILASDCLLFYLARHHNRYTKRLKARLETSRLGKSRLVSREHLSRTIFVLRFVVGLRFVGPVLAGSLNTRWLTFLLPDIAALLIYVPVFAFLGFHFNASFVKMVTSVEMVRHTIFIIAMVVVGLLITYFVHQKLSRYTNGATTPVDTLNN